MAATRDQANSDGRIKILFVVPDLRGGGAEKQVIDLANGLDATRFEKRLAIFEGSLDQLDRVDQSAVEFVAFRRRFKADFSSARDLARLIDRENVDVVHCSLQMAVLMGSLASMWSSRKPKLIAAIHTTVNRSLKNEFFDRVLYRYLLRRFHSIVFVCEAQRDHWLGKYPELAPVSTVIYNGVDTAHYQPDAFIEAGRDLRRRLGIDGDAPVIACIAAFRPEKGHGLLIQAFAELPDETHLILAGDGATRPDMERLAESLGVARRVHFVGSLSDVRPLLAAVALTVLASTAVETFSLAMLESLAMRVPMVATDIGGLREAIHENETGGLAPPNDPDRLAAALRRYLDSGRLREMGAAGRALVLDKFSREQMIDHTQSLVVSLVGKND